MTELLASPTWFPTRRALAAVIAGWLGTCVLAAAPGMAGTVPPLAPLPYRPPEPGSYVLPVLGQAGDGQVLDSDGRALELHRLYGDKIVLLSFIYATCDDANGCPFATAVLHMLKKHLKNRPELGERLRLITLSFDPEHDTPAVMARYARGFQDSGVEWRFLTTRGETELAPILHGYQQTVEKEVDGQGRYTGKFAHLLRIFLIDRQKRIRNIYTVSVLHPDLLVADIQTLAREPLAAPPTPVTKRPTRPGDLFRAGDDKRDYERADYRTRTLALTQRQGHSADLFRWAKTPALGLPPLPIPADAPLTREKIALGRKLFYDRRLSLNATFSCAMCHIAEQGFTSQEQATAIGIEGRSVRRNAPTLYNVAYQERLFHDGRETRLENQAWGPLLASNEMANPSVGFVVDKLRRLPDYRGLFERAFRRGPDMETIGQALASYQRTLISGDSPFDRWYYGKQPDALSPEAQQGFRLFTGKAGCVLCHRIESTHALFTDQGLHNTGLGYRASMHQASEKRRVLLAPGLTVDIDAATLAAVGAPRANDLGRYEITQNPKDRWKYKTPSLRNVALTAPYMHDGSLGSLREVVEFYDRGGEPNENLDPLIRPLGLSEAEKEVLVAFLESLTGTRVDVLVGDAYAAPVGDRR